MSRYAPLTLVLLVVFAGCYRPQSGGSAGVGAEGTTVLLSVTSDANEDPQSIDMAMKLAGFSLDEDRHVVLFFNVKGVTIPAKGFPDDFAYKDNSPIKEQLADLIERGVDVHVCPICMKAHGVEASDLMEGAKVTTRPNLFANIGPGTVVFTY
jgi:predicted peroxiredoxin